MPVLSPAFKLLCPSCGWSKLFPQMGDVRLHGQVPEKCPSCGDEKLAHVKLNVAERMLITIKNKFK